MMRRIGIVLAACLTLISCTSGNDGDWTDLQAGFSEATKVSLTSDFNTVWNSSDKVSVFYKGSTFNRTFTYKGEDGESCGTLRCAGKLSSKAGLTLAAVPYNRDFSRTGDVLTVTIPSEQKHVPGQFDPEAALLAACSEDDNLSFSYLTAFLGVRVECLSSVISVEKVELSSEGGEPLAGKVSVDFSGAEPSVEVIKGESVVTMKSGESGTFVFAVVPGFLSKGFTFRVFVQGVTEPVVLRYTEPILLYPGTLRTIGGSVSLTALKLTVDLTSPTSLAPTLPSSARKSAADGDSYSFVNKDDGKQYEIRIGDTTNGYRFASSCLRLNDGTAQPYTGWIELPSVRGLRLVKLGLQVRNDSGKNVAVSSTPKGGGDIHGAVRFSDDVLEYIDISGSKAGAACFLTDSDKNLQIKKIELFFE